MAQLTFPLPLYFCLLLILLTACSTNQSRYQQKHDSSPSRLPSASELQDATPRAEPHSRGGNRDYQVFGKHYQVLKTAENFNQSGIASWYGRKFHGHLTSNGEIYDMYAMSAAHKNLPIPSYVKVVNNDNGRTVIVRVNDRGPFHQDRIIDLSYSAAHKLDMLKTGTANVSISAITDFSANALAQLRPDNRQIITATTQVAPLAKPQAPVASNTTAAESNTQKIPSSVTLKSTPAEQFIQVFASQSHAQATKLATGLAQQYQTQTKIAQENGIFRVLVGPIKRSDELSRLLLTIKNNGYPKAFIRK